MANRKERKRAMEAMNDWQFYLFALVMHREMSFEKPPLPCRWWQANPSRWVSWLLAFVGLGRPWLWGWVK